MFIFSCCICCFAWKEKIFLLNLSLQTVKLSQICWESWLKTRKIRPNILLKFGSGSTEFYFQNSVFGSGLTELKLENSVFGSGLTELKFENSVSGSGLAEFKFENSVFGSGWQNINSFVPYTRVKARYWNPADTYLWAKAPLELAHVKKKWN